MSFDVSVILLLRRIFFPLIFFVNHSDFLSNCSSIQTPTLRTHILNISNFQCDQSLFDTVTSRAWKTIDYMVSLTTNTFFSDDRCVHPSFLHVVLKLTRRLTRPHNREQRSSSIASNTYYHNHFQWNNKQ